MHDAICATGDKSYATIDRHELVSWLEMEFALFITFLRHVFGLLDVYHSTNAFAQAQHDGVTLADGDKYQALGVQFIFEGSNWNLCFGFVECKGGAAPQVAALFKRVAESRHILVRYLIDIIADFAALAVARALGKEKNGCGMHGDDKIARWAVGLLLKLDGTGTDTAVDPFPQALDTINQLRDYAKLFSYGSKIDGLHKICHAVGCAAIKFDIDLSHTRIAAVRELLVSVLRQAPGMIAYSRTSTEKAAQVHSSHFQVAAELEAVVNVVGKITTLKQSEVALTGGYKPVFRAVLDAALSREPVQVLDVANMTAAARPPRREINIGDMTDVGQRSFTRAHAEFERRYTQEGARMRPQDLIAFACDPRLLPRAAQYLKAEEIIWMDKAISDAYVDYGLKIKRLEHTALVLEHAAPVVSAAGNGEAAQSVAKGLFAAVSCSDDESADESGQPAVAPILGFDEEAAKTALQEEFKEIWPAWQKLGKTIDYGALVGDADHLPARGKKWRELDAVKDLLNINIIPLLINLAESSQYGFLPKLALSVIGKNQSSSFCERINSAGKLVMTDGRTLLGKKHLEMCVVLRINKKFMKYMKKKYKALGKELIKQFAKDTGITPE